MNLDDYQKWTKETSLNPQVSGVLPYYAMGLAGETGELIDKISKIYRDHEGNASAEMTREIEKEIGDVLWYLARTADELNISLVSAMESNKNKLQSRLDRNKISGSGDNR